MIVKKLSLNKRSILSICIRWKDKPKNIPSKPDIIYKNKGWTTWSDFLGSLVISNKDKGQKYLDYQDAKDYLKKLDFFKKVQDHDIIKNNWCLENNIKLIRIPYKKKNKIFKILSIELK